MAIFPRYLGMAVVDVVVSSLAVIASACCRRNRQAADL